MDSFDDEDDFEASPLVVDPRDARATSHKVVAAAVDVERKACFLAMTILSMVRWGDDDEEQDPEQVWADGSPINKSSSKDCTGFLKTFCDGKAGRPKVARKAVVKVLRERIITVIMGWRATHVELKLTHDEEGYAALIKHALHPPSKKNKVADEDEPGGLSDEDESMEGVEIIEDADARRVAKKAPRWMNVENARLIAIIFDPDHRVIIDRALGPKTREEQDDKSIENLWQYIERIFNSDEKFDHVDDSCFDIMELDPNMHVCFRSAEVLKDKFNKVKAAYTIVYRMWDTSGRGLEGTKADLDISLFFDRAGTLKSLRKAVIYMHKTINGDPDFLTFGTRLVDVAATYESGQPRAPTSDRRGSKRKHGELHTASLAQISQALAYEESASEKAANEAMVVACEAKAQALKTKSTRATLDLLLRHRSELSAEQEEKLATIMDQQLAFALSMSSEM